MKFFRADRKMFNQGAGARAAWSRSFLPEAGVGSGTSDVRSCPKKWRLRNRNTGYKIKTNYLLYTDWTAVSASL